MKISAFVVSCLLFLFSFLFFTPLSFATSNVATAKDSAPPSTNVESSVPDNLHNWTQTVMIEVLSSLSCQVTGIDTINSRQSCLGIDQKNGKIGFLPSPQSGGAIGFMGNLISTLYTPPLHAADYFQNLAQNFGITKKTYAQQTGTGFDGLMPLQNLWTAFRNIVYLIFVIVFVVIGLAIMLRVKIDPRTVMTIQNQIPKIIVGILLVTFSYAIGGFLIDMMYVSIHIVSNMVITADQFLDPNIVTQMARDTTPFLAAGHVGADGGNPVGGLLSLIHRPAFGAGEIIGSITTSIFGGFLGVIGRGLFGAIGYLLAVIIIAIVLLSALFKLWFKLIFAYINILLGVVLAPFWIVGSLVPGSPINVGGWLRNLIANLAAFPAVIAMFLLGRVFMDAFSKKDTAFFLPPLIGDHSSSAAIGSIIGFGIIIMTPNVIDMLKSALKVPKIDTGLGKTTGAGVGVLTSAGKGVGGIMTAADEGVVNKAGKWEQRGRSRAFIARLFR